MFDRFVYAKEAVWSYEREQRLLIPLSERDSEADPDLFFRPTIDAEVAALVEPILPLNPKVCLKRIPFDAFKEVLLGYGMSAASAQRVREALTQNPQLAHVSLKRMRINAFGDLVADLC